MKIYLAGPLFTEAEKDFNRKLAARLTACGAKVTLPQESCKGVPLPKIYEKCFNDILDCHMVVAVLDGTDCDSGTCVELGYAWARDKLIFGLRTDERGSGEYKGINAMIPPLCVAIFNDVEQLVRGLGDAYLST